jgi:K+-transporting ATPase ATPase C chain
MTQQLRASAMMLVLFTVLTGIVYPVVVTLVGQVAFPVQAEGSLMMDGETVTGSALIGQNVTAPEYFWSRPSATSYGTLPSGASNAGPTSATLADAVASRAAMLREAHGLAADAPVPTDLLFASGSGVDPHISPDAARFQIDRVADARGFDAAQRDALAALVEQNVELPQFGFLGEARVNVLQLNHALDAMTETSQD